MIDATIEQQRYDNSPQSRIESGYVTLTYGAENGGRASRTHTVAGSPARLVSPGSLVFVVDNDATARATLAAALKSAGWNAETFACAAEFLSRPAPSVPSCLILDVTPPNEENLELQRCIAAARNDVPVVLVADRPDIRSTVQGMKAGALDFFMKPVNESLILSGVQRAIVESAAIQRDKAHVEELRERHCSLTRRERDVMALVVSGLLNKQIASELGISEITVKAHRGRVMRKMQADSLANLVMIASALLLTPVAGVARHRAPVVRAA
ncbi:MAG TPA: LuxR C-terminal-related transcriptional regulator [Rhodanobacteraceae bacterium]|nr:LuxR C-terminal-related transcriptional regulator [Rhodanobacteraceae bacterium]